MTRRLILLLLSMFAMPALAQTGPAPAAAPVRVALETTEGRIVVEVEPAKAPITSANFLRYVDSRRLDGVTFYRLANLGGRQGLVQFGLKSDPKRAFPPIRHEPTTLTGLTHVDGALSMARNAPGTARAEFTIIVGGQPSLDADPKQPGDNVGYPAFGRVVEGMDIVVRILEAPLAPPATVKSGYKDETPLKPVKIVTARRVVS